MRLAVIADSHFDASSRFEECVRVHDWIADDIAFRQVDLVLHAGDVYERKSTPDERRAVAAWVQRVTQVAPLVIVRGNHDAPRDLEILARLETRHPVLVEEAARVHCVAGAVVGCMAWPTRASVLAMAREAGVDSEQLAAEALRNVLRGLGQQMNELRDARGMEGAPKILLAHAMVRGSRVSTGQPLVGCDLELGVEDLALAGADFVALGHIHMPQEWLVGHPVEAVVYPGSPRRTAYGETEQKGYVIADFESGHGCVGWERVPTPCAPMLLLQGEYVWENWHDDPDFTPYFASKDSALSVTAVRGAEVRLRYSVEADRRDEARALAEQLCALARTQGAVDVKLEERVIASSAARAPEVAEARTLPDKLRALWNARGSTPEEPRKSALLGKVAELEGEVQHAV